jgi:hypothetical protein
MGGSQIQLVAYGRQDVHITGNPQITFFKNVFRRHTNFAMEPKQLYFDKPIRLANIDGKSVYTVKILKEADLVGGINLEVKVTGSSSGGYTVNHFGNAIIKEARLKVGGAIIDTHYSQWRQIYQELYDSTNTSHLNESDSTGGGRTIAYTSNSIFNINRRTNGDEVLYFDNSTSYSKTIHVPMRFWFNNSIGNVLPILALNNHEVLLELIFEDRTILDGSVTISDIDIKAYGDYYYLDVEEKRKFSQSSHEYLIEQVTRIKTKTPSSSKSLTELEEKTIELEFYNPIKYITWVVINPSNSGDYKGMGPCYFTSLCSNSHTRNDGNDGNVKFQFNSEDRIITRPMSYYTRYLPKVYRYPKNIPNLDRIGMYSFAINPLDVNPTGTCNFSKILDKDMIISIANNTVSTVQSKELMIFAVNYNIFRVNGGMGGLAYTS